MGGGGGGGGGPGYEAIGLLYPMFPFPLPAPQTEVQEKVAIVEKVSERTRLLESRLEVVTSSLCH